MKSSKTRALATVCAAALALVATQSHAQNASTAPAAANQLQEVVVTAERTQSTVQRTPISIAVVSSERLENAGVTNLGLLTNAEPTVVFNQGQFNGASVTIRGVSSSGSTQFGGSAVTVNTDGQYLYSGFNGVLFDINRIEVLKGPQGTLYGLNATAGAINILTNEPKLGKTSLDVAGELGSYDLRRFEGTINGAAGDTVAVRATYYSEDRHGYRKHPGMHSSDLADVHAVRGSVLWKPVDHLTVRLTGEYIENEGGNTIQQGIPVVAGPNTPAGQPPVNITSAGLNPREWTVNFEGYNPRKTSNVRGNVTYDFGAATLTYIGSYAKTEANACQPAFGTATQQVDFCTVGDSYNKTIEQEVRLNGQTGFGLKWQGGLFYSWYVQHTFVDIYNGATAFSPPRTVPFIYFYQPHNRERNEAAYGQVTQSLSDKLSITGGLRYTDVEQVANPNHSDALNLGPYFGSQGRVITYTRTDNTGFSTYHRWSWKAGVDYQATPLNLIYGSVSTSFKDGGFTQFNSFAPEDITAYEIGSKNRFADGRVELNGAVFYYKYRNQQAQVFVARPDGTTPLTTVNAGSSEVKGAEANLNWLPTRADRISASAAYTDAKFTVFTVAQPIVPDAAGNSARPANLAGNRAPQAPKWTLTGAWDHTFDVGSGQLRSSINTRYVTDYYLSVFNLPGDKVKAFMQTDASLTYTPGNGRWDLTAYVRNIEDHNTLNFAQFLNQGPSSIYMFAWAPPRTWGVRASLHL